MYDFPHQFEPLLLTNIPLALAEKAAEIARSATLLAGVAHPFS
jgi:hypothetical protein